MCGPSGATISRRGSFIETQAFVENKVYFKSGAIFAAVPDSRSNLGTSAKMRPTGGIQVKPLACAEILLRDYSHD